MVTYPEFLIRRLERRADVTRLAAKLEARAGNHLLSAELEGLAALLNELSMALEALHQGQAMPMLLRSRDRPSEDDEAEGR